MKIYLHALGCKTNQYEIEALAQQFVAIGLTLTDKAEEADIHVLNTCSVTAEAGRKSKQMLRRYRKLNPNSIVVAMGCHAQLADLSQEADIVCGTSGRATLVKQIEAVLKQSSWGSTDSSDKTKHQPHIEPKWRQVLAEHKKLLHSTEACPDINTPSGASEFEELGLVLEQKESRAQIKIQDGCNMFCSYCAIALARGRSRSRSRDAILNEARALIARGYKEIVLTGIHICSFESDLGRDSTALAELCVQLNELPGLERIRLGSLEPLSITDEFISTLRSAEKVCPHFHLSLQSGSDGVLKRMRRRYTSAEYRQVCTNLSSHYPKCAFTTDVMVAFPEETAEEFQESIDFVREIGFARMHVFRYSPRQYTPAARWPQVAPEVAKVRAQEMQATADRMALRYGRSFLDTEKQVLVETIDQAGFAYGYTDNYLRVRFNADHETAVGEMYTIKLAEATPEMMFGVKIK